jgi:hypothetical protein
MARARYDPWKGYSSKQLLDMSPTKIGNLGERELRSMVTRLSSAANKRVRSLEKLPFESPALKEVGKEGGRFSGKGKTQSQLISEYQRIKKFMEGETSTVKGARQFQKQVEADLSERFGQERDFFENMEDDTKTRFWNLFNELRPYADALGIVATDFVAVVNDAIEQFEDYDEAHEYITQRLNDLYEEKKEKRRQARKRYRNARSNRM